MGGTRKGFHLAILETEGRLSLAGERILSAGGVLDRLLRLAPVLVAVDAPRRPAPRGERSRACEREFVRAGICALRFTPDLREIRSNPFHDWVLRGLELYAALDRARIPTIECFPTAAWTVWAGPRRGTPRGAWSARALARLRVPGTPARLGQDARDAIGAALTARLHTLGRTRMFGEIVVPAPGT